MNNAIPNVPRELLERLRSYIPNGDGYNSQYANDLADAAEAIERLSAPSPAGVDGWDVAGDILEKLSAAQPIIDGLRGENERIRLNIAEYNEAIACYQSERNQQAQRIGELASHLEFAVTVLTVAGLAGNAQVEAMRAALSAGNEPKQCT